MTKTESSQSQKKSTTDAAAGLPFVWGFEQFSRLAADQIARAESLMAELSTIENTTYERMKSTAADLQAMTSESMAYANELATVWRKAALDASAEAAKHFSGMFQPKAS